jgi:hypothetical protein
VKVLIFDDTLPQKHWRGIIDKAAADVLPDGRAKLYVNHGELVDKASADYGQNYVGALASRRQDIQRGRDVLNTIERRIEDIIEQTKREYGWTDSRAADDPWRAIKWDDLGPGGGGINRTEVATALDILSGHAQNKSASVVSDSYSALRNKLQDGEILVKDKKGRIGAILKAKFDGTLYERV